MMTGTGGSISIFLIIQKYQNNQNPLGTSLENDLSSRTNMMMDEKDDNLDVR